MQNIAPLRLNVGNVLQNIVSPTKHCYGSKKCYEDVSPHNKQQWVTFLVNHVSPT